MARPREFETADVLDRAMGLFWAKGFEASSLDGLCDATGLTRSSLYGAFGDKRALFLETIDRYGDRAVARFRAAFAKSLPAKAALQAFLSEMVNQIVAGPGRNGCFLGNCAAEMARNDPEVAAKVKANLERVEKCLKDNFDKACAKGELSPSADTAALARFFVAMTQGLRIVGKSGANRAVLNDIVTVALNSLEC
jgi:TetR/AcrR family transcriptional repressor of nem operon